MNSIYFGIDLGKKNTILSFFDDSKKEPESVSTIMGSKEYQIPTVIAKRIGIEQWFYGKEAKEILQIGNVSEIFDLVSKALNDEEVILDDKNYKARDLFCMYLNYLLSISGLPYTKEYNSFLIITVPTLSTDVIELCSLIAKNLDIDENHIFIIDYMEAFYYYALNQEKETYLKNVILFECDSEEVKYDIMTLNREKSPIYVDVKSGIKMLQGEKKDTAFYNIVTNMDALRNSSSVYLVGEGFDGGWMQDSMKYLLSGRRVFIGKNLYSKGACFYGYIKNENIPWNYFYIGNNELKLSVSLKVTENNEMKFYVLQKMGENWFKSKSECEVILIGDNEIDFWVQRVNKRENKIEKIVLTELPKRETATTRLKISSKAVSDKEVVVNISDLGFGEISPSSGLKWKYKIKVDSVDAVSYTHLTLPTN